MCATRLQLLGVANLDTFGDMLPPRTLNLWRDRTLGWRKREGVAYLSNVCVDPIARRQGVARALCLEAERIAAQWGCRSIGVCAGLCSALLCGL
jgi:ribosomal protein S18 acetylase RimI-like enzyme